VRGNASAVVNWTAPADDGGSPVTGYEVQVFVNNNTLVQTVAVNTPATSVTVTGLTNGTAYRFRVRARNAIGFGALSAFSVAVVPATAPGAAVIGTATSGAAGGQVNATARWTPPANNGGAPITGYRVRALRMAADGNTVLATTVSAVQPAAARTLVMPLVAGNYRFTVEAINAVGTGPQSARSNLVIAR
jgi:hypothetical protein